MKPDDQLLSDLTPCPTDAAILIAAVRQRVRHRRQFQCCAALAALLLAAVVTLRLLPPHDTSPVPHDAVAIAIATAPPPSPMLTQNQLLDSFGHQPVALVTWPDGRQKLLTIRRPAPVPAGRRVAAR